jgi:hypothetical protein
MYSPLFLVDMYFTNNLQIRVLSYKIHTFLNRPKQVGCEKEQARRKGREKELLTHNTHLTDTRAVNPKQLQYSPADGGKDGEEPDEHLPVPAEALG